MIAPSILASNFSLIKEEISRLDNMGIKIYHFDVMDNSFVPNLTFGHKFIQDLRPWTSMSFDVHLMIERPFEYIPLYVDAGANYISAHIEAFNNTKEIYQTIDYLHKHRIQFGLAVKPRTPLATIEPFLDSLDYVLVMTVEPGFGGQSLIPETLEKVQALQQKNLPHLQIEVDGGINLHNMYNIIDMGADILVMGSAFFNHPKPIEILKQYTDYKNGL